ncbi:MAG: hypothetical protein R6V06_10850, partial [Kiritimatiellia bacterium]
PLSLSTSLRTFDTKAALPMTTAEDRLESFGSSIPCRGYPSIHSRYSFRGSIPLLFSPPPQLFTIQPCRFFHISPISWIGAPPVHPQTFKAL